MKVCSEVKWGYLDHDGKYAIQFIGGTLSFTSIMQCSKVLNRKHTMPYSGGTSRLTERLQWRKSPIQYSGCTLRLTESMQWSTVGVPCLEGDYAMQYSGDTLSWAEMLHCNSVGTLSLTDILECSTVGYREVGREYAVKYNWCTLSLTESMQ